jgi:hypothetical protein
MNRQINVLDCQPDVLLLALPHFDNKRILPRVLWKTEIPMDPAAMLSGYHAPFTNDGYVMRDHFILKYSFETISLASTRDENHHKFSDLTTIRLNNMWQ